MTEARLQTALLGALLGAVLLLNWQFYRALGDDHLYVEGTVSVSGPVTTVQQNMDGIAP